jgi:hypothetical protein
VRCALPCLSAAWKKLATRLEGCARKSVVRWFIIYQYHAIDYLHLGRWLYMLFLGIDANFRLKRLNVSTQERDPGLNYGFAYVVAKTKFKQYLNDYNGKIPDDVSTCNNHDTLKSASMRGGKGTAASGVGAVDCIRHDMKCPMAVGDLQKGEWYVFFSWS